MKQFVTNILNNIWKNYKTLQHNMRMHPVTVAVKTYIQHTFYAKVNPYHRKCHKGEISLAFGLIFTFLFCSYLTKEQEELADGVIRLHVVANSDSDYDQQVKLDVRDQILAHAETLYEEGLSWEEMEDVFVSQLGEFISQGETASQGQTVSAQVTDLYFPTKTYENFAFPAGEYRALEITLGNGTGENWWCVAYPPLCVGAASQTIDEAVEAGNFSSSEKDLISGEYVFKFKSIELWEEFKHFMGKS